MKCDRLVGKEILELVLRFKTYEQIQLKWDKELLEEEEGKEFSRTHQSIQTITEVQQDQIDKRGEW